MCLPRTLAHTIATTAPSGTIAGGDIAITQGAAGLPPQLESLLGATVRPGASERRQLMSGAPLTKLLAADPNSEVAVFGVVWINAPSRRYVEAVNDIENFEKGGGFTLTRRISNPPTLEDFSDLHLPAEDVADLRTCRVGDCKVKMGEKGLQAFRSGLDWNAPGTQAAADTIMRRLALEYVNGYLEGGNDRLAVYRDSERPTFIGAEFRSMVEGMPSLSAYSPDVRRYLLDYPRVQLPGATSFLYWQETAFGLKPTIRINHLTIVERGDSTVVASKMIYATHYFWTALELRLLIPDPERGGFWFVNVNRSRSDGFEGFSGFFVRRRVRSEAVNGIKAALLATKHKLERTRD